MTPRTRGGSKQGTGVGAVVGADFPQLQTFFRAYLHEDLEEEYGTARAAMETFRHDLRPAARKALAAECGRLQALVADMPLDAIRQLIAGGFRSAWQPSRRSDVIQLLAAGQD